MVINDYDIIDFAIIDANELCKLHNNEVQQVRQQC